MIPFLAKFPDLGAAETRTLTLPDEDSDFPAGSYAFLEWYCDEADCDCRRVQLTVVEKSSPKKILATISFGWDLPESFAIWAKASELETTPSGAFLDPIGTQSEWADEILDLFEWMITKDPSYVKRLKTHYAMFKAAPPARARASQAPHTAWRAKRPKLPQKTRRKQPRWG